MTDDLVSRLLSGDVPEPLAIDAVKTIKRLKRERDKAVKEVERLTRERDSVWAQTLEEAAQVVARMYQRPSSLDTIADQYRAHQHHAATEAAYAIRAMKDRKP